MKKTIAILIILVVLVNKNISAQKIKFGKVTNKELEEKFYPQDTSANAVVLYKKRYTHYEYNQSTGWNIITEVHERIKLYNKDGFDNATRKVRLFTRGSENEIFSVKAYTYNLEKGKTVKTKLNKNGIFNEEISKNWNSKNFTMPNLKNGSIIEWKYKITSPYYSSINSVICQYKIPIKFLDIKIQIPEFFEFKYLPSRYYPISVKESKTQKNYSIVSKSRTVGTIVESKTDFDNVSIKELIYTATSSNIPALIEEPYVNNIYNYRAKIEFEIAVYRPTNGIPKYYNTSWQDVTKTIYESQYFGEQLIKKSHFNDDLANVTNGLNTPQEKMNAIFNFVKNKIKWNEEYNKYVSIAGIKKAYKEGVGNVAEINLTLVAMLREAGLKANPILISTRRHGIPLFPTKDGYNYVIAGIENASGVILLDATEKYSTPNVLPLRVLNWEGRLIRKQGTSTTISLYPKKYNAKNTKLSVKLNSEGTITGLMNTSYSNLNALQYRDEYNSLSEDDLISKLETENNGIEIEKIRINNKTKISKPITEYIQFTRENQADIIGDKIYISPLLFLTTNENPFKLKERLYPIDYGSAWKNDYKISIQIPEGFKVESKPEDISLMLPNNMGSYILKTKIENNKINVTSQTKINIAIIGSNHYKVLKELYKQAIDRQLEKIVLVQGQP